MNIVAAQLDDYLSYCTLEKRLDAKTTRAYRCDLTQFADWLDAENAALSRDALKAYLACLNSRFSPATAKRKIASIRAFCAWREEETPEQPSPFRGLRIKMREPQRLPSTIKLGDLQAIASAASRQAIRHDGESPAPKAARSPCETARSSNFSLRPESAYPSCAA